MVTQSRLCIGIDPGLAVTGYGLVQETSQGELEHLDHGVIRTAADREDHERLLSLYQGLQSIVEQYQPQTCAVEKIFMQRNVKTAIRVGQGRGAALIALAGSQMSLREYTPIRNKAGSCWIWKCGQSPGPGNGKIAVRYVDKRPQPDDAADALAVAICHLHQPSKIRKVNNMPEYDLFLRFGTALLIGVLIGLQREYAYGDPKGGLFAGVRTPCWRSLG